MNKQILVVAVSCLIGTGVALAAVYDLSNFNPKDRERQTVPPEDYVVGKDNATHTHPDEHGTHMAGEDCGLCHTPGGKADPNNEGKYVFTMAGTLYEDKAATKPLAGGEVILQDAEGKIISMTSNAAGNFWTYAPIASHPCSATSSENLYTVSGDGTCTPTAGAAADPRSWLYKTWVKKGEQVIQAPDIKPVGGSTAGSSLRMGCGMHHAPSGSRGALWLSEKGTLASYPEEGLSFKKHVQPILMSKCVSCHRPGTTTTRVVMRSDKEDIDPNTDGVQTTQIDYSGNHDLSSYDTLQGGKHGTEEYALGFSGSPDGSPLLTKTKIGQTNHAGGQFWDEDHPDYKAIRQWIAEGAPNN